MNNIVEAVIEIPMGTRNKYEIDKKTNRIKLDRVIFSSMNYPAEYGSISNTLCADGDPLDIVILSSEQTFPGCIVEARVVGYLDAIDNGYQDQKIIAVVNKDPRFDHINELTDIPKPILKIIKNFFATYKTLQNIEVITKEYHSKKEALQLIEQMGTKYLEQSSIEN